MKQYIYYFFCIICVYSYGYASQDPFRYPSNLMNYNVINLGMLRKSIKKQAAVAEKTCPPNYALSANSEGYKTLQKVSKVLPQDCTVNIKYKNKTTHNIHVSNLIYPLYKILNRYKPETVELQKHYFTSTFELLLKAIDVHMHRFLEDNSDTEDSSDNSYNEM